MLLSMTGFGAAHRHENGIDTEVEARTINNRYFKLNLRISEGLNALEPQIEAVVREELKRGTVQLNIRVSRQTSQAFQIDAGALEGYRNQLDLLAQEWGLEQAFRLDALLSLPGVVTESAGVGDPKEIWPQVEATLRDALGEVQEMRKQEGEAMARDLATNIADIRKHLAEIESRAPQVVEDYKQKITERINRHLSDVDAKLTESDLAREIAIFSDRSDIGEEIVRLQSHLDQFGTATDLEEAAGRKLDFITQEMFRETNTIGSKANDAAIAMSVVEIKGAIERIREMVQNIE
ncbi:MAG: YicC family protein [Pirellulales bacterium]|nr:YicC family protein [Pirellulales bacterium]